MEVGFEFDVAQTAVVDHVHHVGDDVTLITAKDFIPAPMIVGPSPSTVYFRGVA